MLEGANVRRARRKGPKINLRATLAQAAAQGTLSSHSASIADQCPTAQPAGGHTHVCSANPNVHTVVKSLRTVDQGLSIIASTSVAPTGFEPALPP